MLSSTPTGGPPTGTIVSHRVTPIAESAFAYVTGRAELIPLLVSIDIFVTDQGGQVKVGQGHESNQFRVHNPTVCQKNTKYNRLGVQRAGPGRSPKTKAVIITRQTNRPCRSSKHQDSEQQAKSYTGKPVQGRNQRRHKSIKT